MKHLAVEIEKALSERHITARKHPSAELWIYNYSPICQYDKIWTDVTTQCRGLILDAEYNIYARPFRKFKNIEEYLPEEIPYSESFEITKKEDGSLGILYWINDVPYIATRGSFESDQAIHGTQILNDKYNHTFDKLKKDRTYLFEIIFPTNRIVVEYGDMEDLILLAIIDNKTGLDLPLEDIGFPIVKRYDGITDINILKSLEKENEEGFVVRFKNGFRCKVKFSEYIRLHKILTQTSNVVIWEFLKDGKPLDEILDKIPDEFYEYIRKTKENLEKKYQEIEINAKENFERISKEIGTTNRKEFAMAVIKDCKNVSSVIFNMLDQREYDGIIWKMIKPSFEKPFKTEKE